MHQAHLVKGALDVLDHQAGLACSHTSGTPQRAFARTRTCERVSKCFYAVVTMGRHLRAARAHARRTQAGWRENSALSPICASPTMPTFTTTFCFSSFPSSSSSSSPTAAMRLLVTKMIGFLRF